METEKQLLDDINTGKRDAMKRLYDRYARYSMAICLRYISDGDAVNDVMQDCYIKIFTSLDSFQYRGEGSLKSWVSRITANEALDYVHRNSRYVFIDTIPEASTDDEPDIDDISNDELTTMISQLPTGYRMVLNMYVFEKMSHKEIAARLGITQSTSASQFYHAKKMLAQMINERKRRQ